MDVQGIDVSFDYARQQDAADPLRGYREQFHFPPHGEGKSIYFCGNSLGLQPRGARTAIEQEMQRWQDLGVKGHFNGNIPWTEYHHALAPQSAHIVGGSTDEVIIMNTLTVNLHLMMVSFYRPTSDRYKIIMEGGAFPSDQYAVESQVRFHGYDPEQAIVEVQPRPGEETLRLEDIMDTIEREGAETALVLFAGMNYYTGQFFNMEQITAAAHRAGAYAGFDLAHAAGNVPLRMHDWGADFAVWCTYKYLNSGPGALSGAFIHERHAFNPDLPRFAGWWGYEEQDRFLMKKGFIPARGAAGWQLSNAPILAFAPMKVSHDQFHEVGMEAIRAKSLKLTGYLEQLIESLSAEGMHFPFITPKDPAQRGAQLSLITGQDGKQLFQHLMDNGVICDWREHNLPDTTAEAGQKAGVIRIAPAPLYNSFEDVWRFVRILRSFQG